MTDPPRRLHEAAWPLIGIVITILVAWFSSREKRPSIAFVVTNQSHVLDVSWPQPDLQVLFRGEDIEPDHLDLEILTVRIENRGQVDILQNQFDQTLRWGFRVEPCRVINVRIAGANEAYLQATRPEMSSDSVIVDKAIFDRGTYVVVQVEVLCPKPANPSIVPYGKVAGIDAFIVERASNASTNASFLSAAFGGAWLVQITRVLGYSSLLALALQLLRSRGSIFPK